jgi:hypothetical protein
VRRRLLAQLWRRVARAPHKQVKARPHLLQLHARQLRAALLEARGALAEQHALPDGRRDDHAVEALQVHVRHHAPAEKV